MPELPDVEVFKRRFDRHCLRCRVASMCLEDKRLLGKVSGAELQKRLQGRRFVHSGRRGKYLFLGLDSGTWLAAHFGMSGELSCADDSQAELVTYERLRLELEGGGRLSYTSRRRLGHVELIEDVDEFIRRKGLGPDALGLDAKRFDRLLVGRRGGIKAALMDQSLIAGLGNIYSDEVLFQAGVHPKTPASRLDKRRRSALFRAMQKVLNRAIEAGADPARLPRDFLIPHRRPGATCPRCGGQVQRLSAGGRNSYFCPACQAPEG